MVRTEKHLFMLMALAALVPCAVSADEQAPNLRVMTFNIRYGMAKDGSNHWEKRKELVAETIRAFSPDLLGTQETLKFQRDFVTGALPEFEAFGAGRDDGKEQGEMAALFYRRDRFQWLNGGNFWMSERPEEPGSKSWDTSLTRVSTWVKLRDTTSKPERELFFFNTHFDHGGRKARAESALLMRRKINEIAGDAPVVLTGDFNAGEGSEPYRNLFEARDGAEARMFDIYRLVHPARTENEVTYNSFDPTRRKGERIDWIAASRHFKAQSAEIDYTSKDGRAPSDHYPVKAALKYDVAQVNR